ncbi:MAG: glycerol-3-phosphate 1-O-acyltransferase PlsB [Gammaproteobacteria bacterium]|nr:glycerol-3-phosphate 1-O-acyltransferase PlsB [Gammaproteobacteria bacterium]
MLRGHGYRLARTLIRAIVRPRIAGAPPRDLPADTVFVLPQRSLSDVVVLDLICARNGWTDPRSRISLGDLEERQRIVFLNRPAGPLLRNTMRAVPERLTRLLDSPAAPSSDIELRPVQVFWGPTTSRERSLIRTAFSEHWAASSRLRRFVNMLISRSHIVVDFGEPLGLRDAVQGDEQRRARRTARILRVRLRQQKVAALGPDFSHRRTLLGQVVESRAVRDVIEQQVAAARRGPNPEKLRRKVRNQAHKASMRMASDMSYPLIRTVLRVLSAFWRRIYDGIEVHGLARIASLGRTHTLVYVPCHRSHIDYLMLSYLLFQRGLMIPHIAAGENMNMPVVGNLLRQGGAFYMQRSFRGDPLHAALFSEYLYQVYRRGHCVEFFPEGSRTRTGRLLPARIGLLKMSIAHSRRGLPRPLAFVPVYFGYEKLIEAASYLDEMRGAKKQRETVADILRSLRLVRQNFGRVEVNFGKPLYLEQWLEQRAVSDGAGAGSAGVPGIGTEPAGDESETESAAEAIELGREILMRINDAASVNPVNLAALVILCTPRLAIAESVLAAQIDCYLDLLRRDSANHDYQLTELDGAGAIAHIAQLGMLNRERHDFGEVLTLQPVAAVQMTWYRNNVAHVLALPSLIACLLEKRRRPLSREAMQRMVELVYPYLARELHGRFEPPDTARWTEHLVQSGLIIEREGRLAPPPARSAVHYRLHLLAGIARPILERNYIVLGLLAEPGKPARTRQELQDRSLLIARKVARMHGINAPEFFDKRVFDAFVDKLIEDGAVIENADGRLARTPIVDNVLRGSETVIDAEYRYAILAD